MYDTIIQIYIYKILQNAEHVHTNSYALHLFILFFLYYITW